MANAGHLLRANDAERKPIISVHFLEEGDTKGRDLSNGKSINFNLFWTPPLKMLHQRQTIIMLKKLGENKNREIWA